MDGTRSPRSHPGRLRLLLATGFGAGYLPLAPGTFGSLPALLLVWALWQAGERWIGGGVGGAVLVAAGLGFVTALGFWSAGAAARWFEGRDPGPVVIDEVAGQMVALLLIRPTLTALAAGFLLFRVLDIVKPPPVRRLEALPGGSGIMADDLLAGLYANLLLRATLYLLGS